MRGFDAAQRAYDNALPPEDGPCECPDCNGVGYTAENDEDMLCPTCTGFGWLLDGEPYDKWKAEYEADAAAEHRYEQNPER